MSLLLLLASGDSGPPVPDVPDPVNPDVPLADALLLSHRVAVVVEVLSGGQPVALIEPSAGSVTLDRSAAIRGRCTVEFPGAELVPSSPSDLLAPYGNELRIKRGVQKPDGSTEVVSLGVFGIQDTEAVDTGGEVKVVVSGEDRSKRVRDARFVDPYEITAGTNYATAIQAMITAGVPGTEYAFASTTRTTPALVFLDQDDRWDRAASMAESFGHELFFGDIGQLVLAAEPDLSRDDPVATFSERTATVLNPNLLGVGKRWTRRGTYNAVIATGESTSASAPVRASAVDDDPGSPTYWSGPFGQVPRFYASPLIATTGQAQEAAAGILRREKGTSRQVSFSALVSPTLRPSQVVLIRRDRLGINELHVIDSVTIPLRASQAMTAQTRARQTT